MKFLTTRRIHLWRVITTPFRKKKTICKFVIFNEDLGSGWGGALGGVKFILELLNFKEDSASGWGGFGKGWVGVGVGKG